MMYVVKQISELPDPLVGYSVTDIENAYQSIDVALVLLKITRPTEEETLSHSEMKALLQSAEWKVEDPAK